MVNLRIPPSAFDPAAIPKKYLSQVSHVDFSRRWHGTPTCFLSSRRMNSRHPRPEKSTLTEASGSYRRPSDRDPVAQAVRKMGVDRGAR